MPDILINLGSRYHSYHLTWEYGAPLVDLVGNEVASDPRCCPLNVSGKTSLSNPVTKGKLRSYGCFMLFPPDSPFFEPLGATYWNSPQHVIGTIGIPTETNTFIQHPRSWFLAVADAFKKQDDSQLVNISLVVHPPMPCLLIGKYPHFVENDPES